MLSGNKLIIVCVVAGLILLFILWRLYRSNFKSIVTSAVALITGAPKTGKTLLNCTLSTRDYKSRHRKWWVLTHIFKRSDIEEPLFYTNGTFSFGNTKYVGTERQHKLDKNIRAVTMDLLMRKTRFAYGSVIFIQEASLVADNLSFNVKDGEMINVKLSLFNKLIGHETRGGALYYDTQNQLDVHFAIKRVCSNFFFVQKSLNFGLFRVLYIREMIAKDLGENNFTDDLDVSTRKVLIPRWYYKHYDRYEYSYLTDNLPISQVRFDKKQVVSFNPLYLKECNKENEILC